MGDDKSSDPPVHFGAEWQLPFSQGGNAPGGELWNRPLVGPVRYRADCDVERLGGCLEAVFTWVEVPQNVLFEHDIGYSMFNSTMEYSTDAPAYSNGMQTQTMGERIRQLRLARGWSQGDLAERVGVTGGAISHWESGLTKNIKLETFLTLCEVLGTVPHYLIFGPGKHLPPGRRQA